MKSVAIDGIRFNVRSHGEWSNRGFRNPTRKIGRWDGQVGHWPGVVKGVKDHHVEGVADEVRWLQEIEAYHLGKRNVKGDGWAYAGIAYNWAVGRHGIVYELRGSGYTSGAHSPKNSTHEAVLFLYSTDEEVPEKMKETFKAFRKWRISTGVGAELIDHSQVPRATSCAGDSVRHFFNEVRGQVKAQHPSNSGGSSSNLLRFGSRGDSVKALQSQLNGHGYKLVEDGIFGELVRSAVIDFQKSRNITVDGIVGPQTRAELAKASPAKSASKAPRYPGKLSGPGSTGERVKKIQTRLNERGWKYQGSPLAVDGIYGDKTTSVVTWFQQEKGLRVDGIVGPETWKALWELPF